MSFTFGGITFTQAHIVTPLNEILVIISTPGPDRRIQFSNINPFGTGPFIGAIDFIDGASSDVSTRLNLAVSYIQLHRQLNIPQPEG